MHFYAQFLVWLLLVFSKVIFNDVLVSSTLKLPVNICTWKKKKTMLARGTKIIVIPGEHGFFFYQV